MSRQIKRREFIALLGSSAFWPQAARAQQTTPVIGFLHAGSFGPSAEQVQGFLEGLRESGYVERQNVTIDYRWADGRYERLPELAISLVGRSVAILVAGGGPAAAHAAKGATTTIPIVFISGDDPVKRGLVASLNRPGGNITGSVFFNTALVGKRLALLHDLVPSAKTCAYLTNPNNPEESEPETRDAQAAARLLGIELHVLLARNADEIDAAFAKMGEMRAQMLVIASDPFLFSRREQIATLARRAVLPVAATTREYVSAGLLASYGNSIPEAYRQAGLYAGRILKGAKPADLPVFQSTKFTMAINLQTAKSLGIVIPANVLALADEVIE